MKPITEPGLYEIDMATYHGDCCAGPSISASGLVTLLHECPAIYWSNSALNPKREPETTTKALDVGRAAHTLALGEPEFAAHFVVSIYDEFRTNEAKAWRVKILESGRTVLKAADFDLVRDMAAAIKNSPQVARAFRDGKPERSLIWQDEDTGVWLKSRPDWLPDDPASGFIIDYKTTADLRPRKFSAQAFDLGWHLQAALQADACRAVLGVEPLGVAHVAQEKAPPYLAELRLFTPEQIDFGRREYRRALRKFAACWKLHQEGIPERLAWPGYTAQAAYVETPYYIAKQMEDPFYGHEDSPSDDASDYLGAA